MVRSGRPSNIEFGFGFEPQTMHAVMLTVHIIKMELYPMPLPTNVDSFFSMKCIEWDCRDNSLILQRNVTYSLYPIYFKFWWILASSQPLSQITFDSYFIL